MSYFTPEDVNRLIPALEKIIAALQQLKREIDEKGHRLQRRKAAAERAGEPGRGSDEFMAEEAELEFLVMQAQLHVRRVEELGGQLKGLWPGLVDFPALIDGEPVLLCWRQGEERVRYYHLEDAGFAGRRLLPGEAPDGGGSGGGSGGASGASGGAIGGASGGAGGAGAAGGGGLGGGAGADGGDADAAAWAAGAEPGSVGPAGADPGSVGPAAWPTRFSDFAARGAASVPLPSAAREFLHLFNTVRDYYTAHDVLEEYWRHEDTDDFWKALIQVAVGFVHLGRGNLNGCRILWRRAARYLGPYEPTHYGLDVAALRDRLLADADTVSADPACQPGARIPLAEAEAWVERLRYRL